MAANHPIFSIADLPADMVTAVEFDASRDADRVILFLNSLGLGASPEKPMSIPGVFLLHLGAALRLLSWEAKDFFFHFAAGLPKARQAIRDAFKSLDNPNADATELCVAILRLSVERFAWSGPTDLGADVSLDEVQEDILLDAMADFLWASRPR